MFPVRLIAAHPRLVIPNEVEESLVLGDVSTSPDMTKTPEKIQNFIDGQFVEPVGGRYLDNIEPATGKPYSQVADSDARDVELAVAAAEKAFADWSSKSGRRAVANSAAHRRLDRARSGKIRARRIDRYRQAALARAHARHSARRRAISAFSRPRFCTPNPKRTSPTTSRSTTRCASRAASPD